jgi:hypothetical protein
MHETFVIEFVAPVEVELPRERLRPLGLALLEALPGRLTLANIATPEDAHLALRVNELARQLRRFIRAIRLETPRERQERRERAV